MDGLVNIRQYMESRYLFLTQVLLALMTTKSNYNRENAGRRVNTTIDASNDIP